MTSPMMSTAKPKPSEVLEEECGRSLERRRLLHQASKELQDGFLAEALHDLLRAVEMLSASEERVMQLYAECHAMIAHCGKILETDAMRRPVVLQVEAASLLPGEESGGKR